MNNNPFLLKKPFTGKQFIVTTKQTSKLKVKDTKQFVNPFFPPPGSTPPKTILELYYEKANKIGARRVEIENAKEARRDITGAY